ncbi:hypothetical protein GE061_001350 [Apolygus lucorum]|uniref:Uncharacterized protein n=1 Tax=Apolygus lucorum TaxID=248454 RepID=A0A6A4J1F2_APOLU|nr:hypothetical protein GE061_001350 [Apolygus lucorum]
MSGAVQKRYPPQGRVRIIDPSPCINFRVRRGEDGKEKITGGGRSPVGAEEKESGALGESSRPSRAVSSSGDTRELWAESLTFVKDRKGVKPPKLRIRSVDKKHHHQKHHGLSRQAPNTKPGSAAPNRYCQCTSLQCNCCRDFSLPVVSLKGPGCANVQYLTGDSMRLTMSFGDRILRNMTLNGKKPRPVCVGLPGAETKFCGRIYGIQRVGDQFKACLALEMRSLDEIEAALRVSCFKFGPDGVKLEPGRPVPGTDDYDDDDDYGFDEDDDDDDDDFLADDDDDDDEENDVDSGDYTGFSALGDEFLDGFFGGGSSKKKKKTVTTTATPVKVVTKKPNAASATTMKTQAIPSTTLAPGLSQSTTPGKSKNVSESTVMGEMNEDTTGSPMVVTSTEFSIKVVQDGNTIEDTTNNIPAGIPENTHNVTAQGVTDKITTQSPKVTDVKDEDEDDDEEENEEEEEEEEGSTDGGLVEKPKEKEELLQAKDDDENILDGILGSDDDDDDEDDDEDDDTTNNNNKEEEDDDDDDEDEFRQLRSHIPRGPYHPMTLEDQERQFPGLSALIKPPSVPFMSLQEQERRFPGLSALIRPPPVPQLQPEIAFDFPPVRSARTHRRMRLPPL